MNRTTSNPPAETVRVLWCRECNEPADLSCTIQEHTIYKAEVVPLGNDGQEVRDP